MTDSEILDTKSGPGGKRSRADSVNAASSSHDDDDDDDDEDSHHHDSEEDNVI